LVHRLQDAGELAALARHSFSEDEWSAPQAALGPTPTRLAS
jgi:hypothetical protein